jgi:hypothetical protein
MNADIDAYGPRYARYASSQDGDERPPPSLNDSWFKWPKPLYTTPPPVQLPKKRGLDDDVADDWFV